MHFQLGTSDLTYIIDEDFEHLDLGQTYATATGSMLFAYRSGAGNADIEANFDDYALRNVPEPASATGIALGLLAIVRRRKTSRR